MHYIKAHADSISNSVLCARAAELLDEYEEKYVKKYKHKSLVADIRFENQIIISENRGK